MSKSKSVPFMAKPESIPEGTVGSAEFDPLGLSATLPFKWMQEAEIKHGRISMLAFVGAVAQEAHPLGIYPDSPTLFTQAHDWGAHNGSLLQILLFTSLFEALTTPAVIQMLKGETDREAGDFCLDPLGAGKKDMAYVVTDLSSWLSSLFAREAPTNTSFLVITHYSSAMKLREIKNGRLAMRMSMTATFVLCF
jgi:Chlorophyll A-B binding protein